jgi:hypothetical protein
MAATSPIQIDTTKQSKSSRKQSFSAWIYNAFNLIPQNL